MAAIMFAFIHYEFCSAIIKSFFKSINAQLAKLFTFVYAAV